MGTLGGALYSFSLAIFYMCSIKFHMREKEIEKVVEPFLHIIPNILCVGSSLFICIAGYANPAGFGCWIAPYPQDCVQNPDVTCVRGEQAFSYRWLLSGVPVLVSFSGSFIIMIIVSWEVFTRHKRNDSYLRSWRQTPTPDKNRFSRFRLSRKDSTPAVASASGTTSPSNNRKNREVFLQACLFIGSLLITNIFSYVYRIVEQVNGKAGFGIVLLAKIFQPLQGMFNIIAYTHPHVTALRRNSDYSWFRAFCIVVSKGGDFDGSRQRRRSSTARTRESMVLRALPSCKDIRENHATNNMHLYNLNLATRGIPSQIPVCKKVNENRATNVIVRKKESYNCNQTAHNSLSQLMKSKSLIDIKYIAEKERKDEDKLDQPKEVGFEGG
mmetsp:Transcript_20291/g.20562  ORF Transcript_20291/g.20562 Transcript_20291/m.20562 type:complete len:384 (-) Transcript_20291:553-1704(-)